jgi:hypothetical protein
VSTSDGVDQDKLFGQIADWMEVPRTPGKEASLKKWLAADPENENTLKRWQRLNDDAKQLQIVAPDYHPSWDALREAVGLRRMPDRRRRKRRRSHHEQVEFYRRPLVAAVLAMLLLSAFLWALFLIRTRIGF